MRFSDLTGRSFGRLTVVERAENRGRHIYWLCVCECGTTRTVKGDHLKSGGSQSCGCRLSDSARERAARSAMPTRTTHGHGSARAGTRSGTYISWSSMIQRTTNPRNPAWPHYGGRGITVCDRWRSYEAFLQDMGERPPGLTLDRIDVNGHYEPGNCRWATWSEQRLNQRRMAHV